MVSTDDDLPTLAPEDAAEADDLLRGVTEHGTARKALGAGLEALRTGQLATVSPRRHADGSPRGIAALIPDPDDPEPPRRAAGFGNVATVPAAPVTAAPIPRAPATTATVLQVTARKVEADWLVCTPELVPLLHFADLDRDSLAALAVDGYVRGVGTVCGRSPNLTGHPGPVDQRASERCTACCAACGYPDGQGSPSGDVACAARLEERLEVLG